MLKNLDRKKFATQVFLIIAGNIIFAVGVNQIITPMNLYNGGFTGISQLIRTILVNVIGIPVIPGVDYLGIIYFLVNVPLFVYAYKVLGKEFCISSIISIALASLAMSMVPVAKEPLFDNYLAACLVGGVVAGVGAGMVMRAGSSGGGQDIIGMGLSKTHPNFSVGKVNIAINLCIYAVCLFMFNIEVVIYSFIYATVIGLAIDRVHVQNINMQAMIFTKKEGISDAIMTELGRGVTRWEGEGAYTNQTTYVLCVMLSKYEMTKLLEIVRRIDPNAFVTVNEGAKVYGNFNKNFSL
ncbi:MAG: YitT family protein [Clostridiales bacterium]|nr:YitT family protein [Candidatus Crickella merdequi]